MKKTLLAIAALFCATLSANAEYPLDSKEVAAWTNLNTSDFTNNDYIGEWGRLKLVGNQLCSEKGDPIQLRGWSTYSINYDEVVPCLAGNGFEAMKKWGANIVRLAIWPKNSKGVYSSETDEVIEKYIRYASEQKMYVLVDWHVTDIDGNSGNPATYKDQAIQMFTNITKFCSDNGYTNVLYEICNECSQLTTGLTINKEITWDDIKSYANEVLPVIESGDPGAIVIIGTPNWDQEIISAVNSPIKKDSYPNLGLMYSFHFHSCSHVYLIGNIQSAAASIPVFVSEWGPDRYDGAIAGGLCEDYAEQFLGVMRSDSYNSNNGEQLISWCAASWGKSDTLSNSLIDCSSFTKCSLSDAGLLIARFLNTGGRTVCCGYSFDRSDCEQSINTEGIENESAEMNDINLYPNPTNGSFTVKLKGAANVSIYDATGSKVYDKDVDGDVTVNNNFVPGIYNVKVETANGTKSMKLEVR